MRTQSALTAIIVVFLTGCGWLYPRSTPERAYQAKPNEYTDSLRLIGELNDTTFRAEAISKYLQICQNKSDYFDTCENNDNVPLLNVILQNLSDTTIMTPTKDLYFFNQYYNERDLSGIELYIGSTTGNISFVQLTAPTLRDDVGKRLLQSSVIDSFYQPIFSHDFLVIDDTFNIIDDLQITSLTDGEYFLLVGYRNWYWQDTSFPVWIGEIWSDTIWFRIED